MFRKESGLCLIILLLHLLRFTDSVCKCGYGSYCRIVKDNCLCAEISSGLYETPSSPTEGCNTLKNHCISNPCQNGGTCFPSFGSFYCTCPPSHHGQACDLEAAPGKKYAKNVMVYYDIHEAETLNGVTFLVIVKEEGDNMEISVDDGDGWLQYTPYVLLNYTNPRKICQNIYLISRNDVDPRICNWIPNEITTMMILQLLYPIENKPGKVVYDGTVEMGRLDKVSVLVTNSGETEYKQEFPVFTSTNLEDRKCIWSIQLEGGSDDMKKPKIYYRKQNFIIKSVTKPMHTRCKFITEILYVWHTVGYRPRSYYSQLKNGTANREFLGMNIDPGIYTVQLIIDIYGSPEAGEAKTLHRNVKRCWFEMKFLQVVARIKYGRRRIVQQSTKVTVDASPSRDPNYPDNSRLIYSWFCNEDQDFCSPVTDSNPVRVISSMPIGVYEINLSLTHKDKNVPHASTSQIIEVVTGPILPNFELVCLTNCFGTRVYELTHLELKGLPPGKTVRWSFIKDDGAESSADNLKQGNTPDEIFIIKRNVLERDSHYRIKAQVDNTYSEVELITVRPPIAGNCEIEPKSGVKGYTLFDISCFDFKSYIPHGESIQYDIYQKVVSSQYSGKFENFILSSSTEPKTTNLQLINEEIIIKVSNSFGDSVTKSLKVELKEPVINKHEIENFVLKVQENIRNGEIEKAISSIYIIADHIGAMSRRLTTINTLIKNLNKIPLLRVLDAEQVVEGLHFLLYECVHYDSSLLSSSSVALSASTLRKVTSVIINLYANSSFVDTDDVIGLARSLLGCVNSLILTKNKYLIDKTQDLELYQYSYNRYIKATYDLLKIIDGYSKMLFKYMVPCQEPIKVEEETIITQLLIDRMNRLTLLSSIDPTGQGSAYIKFDPQLSDSYKGRDIEVQVTHFLKNWFWWVESDLPTDSEHLNVVLGIHNGYKISSPKYPVHVFMKARSNTSSEISGEATQPDPFMSAEIKDLMVKVFTIEKNKDGTGTLFLDCPDLVDVELDVLVTIDEYPDYDKVRANGETLNNQKYSYQTKSFSEIDPEAVIYLGVLPGKKHSVGEVVKFKCYIEDKFCRTWSKENWDITLCEIGPESKHELIHCQCKHLSTFGSSLLVPPNEVHPMEDIILFFSLKDNPYVFSFVILFLLIYFALFIWAWRMDQKDKNERIVRLLVDNFPGETYGYLLAVFTGEKAMSGTTAHVGVKICGSNYASHAHILNHDKDVLQLAQDNWFLIFTEKHLGKIQHLHVWHDNYGASPDWYCKKIVLYDLSTKDKYIFLVEKWLSIHSLETNWRLEWMLLPVKSEEIVWRNLARENFFINLRELHLWISIFVRHPRTAYTRLQRLTVAMCIIMISMLLAIMFYGAAENMVVDDPTYSLTVREMVVAIECLLISLPISILIATLFKCSRRKQAKKIKQKKKQKGERTLCSILLNFLKGILTLDPLMPVELFEEEAPQVGKDTKLRKVILIIAWTLSFVIIFGSSYFLILYGLKLGPNKSLTWVSVTLLRLGQTIFIIQPIRIILFALIFTFLFKEYNRNVMLFSIEYKGIDHSLKEDIKYMTNLMELRSKPIYNPLSQLEVMMLAKRRKRTDEQKWRMVNFLFVGVLLFSLWILIAGTDYSVAYYNTEHLYYLIKTPAIITDFDIDEVYNETRFFDYTARTLLPSLHITEWYNGMDLPIENEEVELPKSKRRGWIMDFSSKILGVPRLRQLRITNETCSVPKVFKSFFAYCNASYSSSIEDHQTYGKGWMPPSSDKKEEHWLYSSDKASETVGMYGASGYLYPGGGYIKNLTTNWMDSSEEVFKLKINNWFDDLTRAIFIEFNLYNANSNLFSQVTIIAENLASGVIGTRVYIDTAYYQFYLETLDIPFLVAFIFFILILILSLMRVVIYVSVQGIGPFLNSHGNVIDVLILFFGFSSVLAYMLRVSYFKVYSEAYEKSVNEEYISFAYPFYQDDLGSIILSILIVITTVRLLQLVHYGKYYYILRNTVNQAWAYIICSLALILFFTSLLSMVAYVTEMQNYRMFNTLIKPKINFLDLHEYLEMNVLFKVGLNLIYFIGGMFITAVFIVFYAKSKFFLINIGRVEAYSNHFRFLYNNFQNEIKKLLMEDIELRIQQGIATREEKNKYRRKLYDAAKQRVTQDFKLKKWEADDIMADFVTVSKRHKKMCDQIDQILELIE